MSIKPVTIASVLGKGSTPVNPNLLRDPGNKPHNNNRFTVLRDRSGSPSGFPPLSPAAKRPLEGVYMPEPTGKNPRLEKDFLFKVMEDTENRIRKGKDSVNQLKGKLADCKNVEPALMDFLGGLVDSMGTVLEIIESVSSTAVDKAALTPAPLSRSRAHSWRAAPGIIVNGQGRGGAPESNLPPPH